MRKGWKKRLAESLGFTLGNVSTWISRDKIPNAIVVKIAEKGYPPEKWLHEGPRSGPGSTNRKRSGGEYKEAAQSPARQTGRDSDRGSYGIPDLSHFQIKKPISRTSEQEELIEKLIDVLQSGNVPIIRAITANIEAFHLSTVRYREQAQKIEGLEEKLQELSLKLDRHVASGGGKSQAHRYRRRGNVIFVDFAPHLYDQ